MRVRLLGSAAGGGFPQWNCNCDNCRCVRHNHPGLLPRTQSCVAISADGRQWFLVNASPDILTQIQAFPPLAPSVQEVRGTGIEGILITNADLDHTLGLFMLREGRPLFVHATSSVRRALSEGLALDAVLSCYCGVNWQEPATILAPLLNSRRDQSGLLYQSFSLPGKPPRYREAHSIVEIDDCVGYRFVDEATGASLLVMPDVAALNDQAAAFLSDCTALLMDGTFWSENEMHAAGVGEASASRMGHWHVGGTDGSLALLTMLPDSRKIYTHINNTNPILRPESTERAAVEAAGCEVGYDGLHLEL